ncbi:hypothetical protein HDU78_002992 [Chytriomyces hyalinus]|nr:hypothetical protein HDU78_002992 [Chytriomyces hyalinus]
MEALPQNVVNAILQTAMRLPTTPLSERMTSNQEYVARNHPGDRLLHNYQTQASRTHFSKAANQAARMSHYNAITAPLVTSNKCKSIPTSVLLASVCRMWRRIISMHTEMNPLTLLTIPRVLRISLGVGMLDDSLVLVQKPIESDSGHTSLSFDQLNRAVISSRAWNTSSLAVSFPAISELAFKALLTSILNQKLHCICCSDAKCDSKNASCYEEKFCSHVDSPHHHHHHAPALSSISLVFRAPEWHKHDTGHNAITDSVWTTVHSAISIMSDLLREFSGKSFCRNAAPVFHLKSLHMHVCVDSKGSGRTNTRPVSATPGRASRVSRISTVAQSDSEDDEWTRGCAAWMRLSNALDGSLESLQMRLNGPVENFGWLIDESVGGDSGKNAALSRDDLLAQRRHFRVFENENGQTTIFNPRENADPGVEQVDESEWQRLEQVMYGNTPNPTSSQPCENCDGDTKCFQCLLLPPAQSGSSSSSSSSNLPPPSSHARASENLTSAHHPTLLIACKSPKLTHLRQEAHGLQLRLISQACPFLTTLHISSPAWTFGTLENFQCLTHLTLGNGNWEDGYFAGSSSGGGEQGAYDSRRGVGYGMRGSFATSAPSFMELGADRVMAVKKLMMSMTPAIRARLETLAVGEISLDTVVMCFVGSEKKTNVSSDEEDRDVVMGSAATSPAVVAGELADPDASNALDSMEQEEVQDMGNSSSSGSARSSASVHVDGEFPDFSNWDSIAATGAPVSPFAQVANTSAKHARRAYIRVDSVLITPPPFASLTRLWLRVIPRPRLDQIEKLIAQCPRLEYLDISHAGPNVFLAERFILFAMKLRVMRRALMKQAKLREEEDSFFEDESPDNVVNRLVINLWIAERAMADFQVGSLEREIRAKTVLQSGEGVHIRFCCDLNDSKFMTSWNSTGPDAVQIDIPTSDQMYALHGAALVVIAGSMVGSAIMVIDSIRRGKHKSLSGRFPIYLGALNFIWSIGHSLDHTWMIVEHGLSPPDEACKTLGGLLSIFLFAEIFLIDAMALFMLATVHFRRQFTLGRYDWLLFVFVIGAPICYLIFAAAFNALGHDHYWCFLDVATSSGRILWAVTSAAACACVLIPAISFFLIYRILNAHQKEMKGMVDTGDFTVSVIKKLLMFQASVTYSFCGIAMYGIAVSAFQREPLSLVFFTVLTINSGGWINCVIYIMQEYHGVGGSSAGSRESRTESKGQTKNSTVVGVARTVSGKSAQAGVV